MDQSVADLRLDQAVTDLRMDPAVAYQQQQPVAGSDMALAKRIEHAVAYHDEKPSAPFQEHKHAMTYQQQEQPVSYQEQSVSASDALRKGVEQAVAEISLTNLGEDCDEPNEPMSKADAKDELWTAPAQVKAETSACSDDDDDDDDDEPKRKRRKKRKDTGARQKKVRADGEETRVYVQTFNRRWLDLPDMRKWLLEDPNDNMSAVCRFCNTNLRNPNKTALVRHAKSLTHITNMQSGGRTITPQAAKKYKNGVTEEMLRHPQLAAWLCAVPNDPTRAWCKFCGSYKAPDMIHLIQHSKSKRHLKNMETGQVRHMMEQTFGGGAAAGSEAELDYEPAVDRADDDDDSDDASPKLRPSGRIIVSPRAHKRRKNRPPSPVECDFSRRITNAIGIGNRRVGFIGAGQIAQAIARGILDQNLLLPQNVLVSAPSQRNTKPWKRWKCIIATNNDVVMQEADVIFLAVRWTVLKKMISQLQPLPDNKPRLIISLVPGVTRQRLAEMFEHVQVNVDTEETPTTEAAQPIERGVYVVRAAPTKMSSIGSGFCAYCTGEDLPHALYLVLETMFSALGRCVKVDEDKMDIYTTIVTGCAAFTCQFIDAMAQGGVNQNLPWDDSFIAIANVVRGTAELLLRTNEEPSVLRKSIATPGTGVLAAIGEFQRGGLEHHAMSAMEVCSSKTLEMADKI